MTRPWKKINVKSRENSTSKTVQRANDNIEQSRFSISDQDDK